MATFTKTYHFGHDIEIRDQVILEEIMKEMNRANIDIQTKVTTTKEDDTYNSMIQICVFEPNNDDYISSIIEIQVSNIIDKAIENLRRKYEDDGS